MTTHILRNILVERRLDVNHLVELVRDVEDGEVNDEGVALAGNYILSYHLVGAGVRNLAKVDVRGKDVGLYLVLSDLTRVQLQDEVLLECLHGIVFL